MARMLIRAGFTIVAFVVFSTRTALAGDRKIVGGDLLYTEAGAAKDEGTASFLAQQAAIKALATECKFASRETRIWSSTVERSVSGADFAASATVGMSFESCQEAKVATGKSRERLMSIENERNQALYELHLKKQLGLIPQPRMNTTDQHARKQIVELNQKVDGLSQKIDEKRPSTQIIVVREPATQASNGDMLKALCMQQYRMLMRRAESAANSTFPIGNLAQEPARSYWNEAEEVRRGCQ